MRNYYFMYYKPSVLVSAILLLGSGISALLTFGIEIISTNTSFSYYQYPTATAVVGVLLYLNTEKWWKYKPFNMMFITSDMNGRYVGKISFKHPITLEPSEKSAVMEIVQTGSKIKINCFFQREDGREYTTSKSEVETIKKSDDETLELHFTYRNKGTHLMLSEHSGTNILRYYENEEGQFLEGYYYTNREPQTKGEIKLKFESNKLMHTV